ncbi:amino acid permease [Streptomyces sp. NPDC101490]|uniref:amino acid permease n=1 Tax=Streptomyces sp. NPDC101490 TaxID=3366143 RepID=UPI0038181CDC
MAAVTPPPAERGPAAAAVPPRPRAYLSVFNLAVLTVVAVASLRSLPTMSTYGLGSITLYLIPALFFLVPVALVAAELATGWNGGVFVWVREAMGARWGFVAIWLQWIQNVVWFPVQLAFIAASFTFVLADQNLSGSGLYTAIVIVVLYWASTALTLRGGNLFAKVGSWGGLIGTIAPGVLLIVLGACWLGTGQESQVPLHWGDVVPPFTGFASLVLIVSNFLAYAGMEVNAVHATDMRAPGKGYPKAVFIAVAGILGVFILPTLAVALAVPKGELGLTTGINLAFKVFFDHWGVPWATAVVSAAIAVGALASVVTWIAGPSKGVLAAAETGLMPPWMQKRNKAGVQQSILLVQGLIVTALAALFIAIPNVSTAFFTLVDMAAALYLIMYMLMFVSALRLRGLRPDVVRAYRVPAIKLVAGIGFAASAAAFALGFVPPQGLSGIPPHLYPVMMLVVIVALGTPPLLFYRFRRPGWNRGRRVDSDATAPAPTTPTEG